MAEYNADFSGDDDYRRDAKPRSSEPRAGTLARPSIVMERA